MRHREHIRVPAIAYIDWIRTDGNYLHIHVGPVRYLRRDTLRHLRAQLDPTRFLRVHRGTVVNPARVREVHPLFKCGAEVVLQDGTGLDLSRRFRAGADSVGVAVKHVALSAGRALSPIRVTH